MAQNRITPEKPRKAEKLTRQAVLEKLKSKEFIASQVAHLARAK